MPNTTAWDKDRMDEINRQEDKREHYKSHFAGVDEDPCSEPPTTVRSGRG